jgi:hypothetical protein
MSKLGKSLHVLSSNEYQHCTPKEVENGMTDLSKASEILRACFLQARFSVRTMMSAYPTKIVVPPTVLAANPKERVTSSDPLEGGNICVIDYSGQPLGNVCSVTGNCETK